MSKLVLALIMLVACSSSSKPTAKPIAETPGGGDGSSAPSDNHASCTTSDDCVVVETGCCDHCNGGKAEAYNKAHADAHKPSGSCTNTACTELACGKAVASCEDGTCTVSIAPL